MSKEKHSLNGSEVVVQALVTLLLVIVTLSTQSRVFDLEENVKSLLQRVEIQKERADLLENAIKKLDPGAQTRP